jgi:hypothetical protein
MVAIKKDINLKKQRLFFAALVVLNFIIFKIFPISLAFDIFIIWLLMTIYSIFEYRNSGIWFVHSPGMGRKLVYEPVSWQGLLVTIIYFIGFPVVMVGIFGVINIYQIKILMGIFNSGVSTLLSILIPFILWTLFYMWIAKKKS